VTCTTRMIRLLLLSMPIGASAIRRWRRADRERAHTSCVSGSWYAGCAEPGYGTLLLVMLNPSAVLQTGPLSRPEPPPRDPQRHNW